MLQGKCCLVTGGAQGLGKSIAIALLKENAKVFLVDLCENELVQTSTELNNKYGAGSVYFRKCDVTKDLEDTFKEAHATLRKLDIVANNAAVLNEYDLDLTINTNLLASMKGTNLAVQYMSPEKGGSGGIIINTASIGGLEDIPHMPAYCAAKTGLVAYTSSLAKNPDVVAKNIRMNCLCPGRIKTNMTNLKYIKTLMEPQKLQESMDQDTIMTPEYVAAGFMEIVNNTEMNGACLKVSHQGGYEICYLRNQ